MDAMEDLAERVKEEAGRILVGQMLTKLGEETNTAKPCPKCGELVPVKAKKRPRTFRSLSGEHTIERNYHYCLRCKGGFYPRDIELGLPVRGDVTFGMEKRVLDLGMNDTF